MRSVLPLPFVSVGVALLTAGALTAVALGGPASPGAGGSLEVTPPPHSNPVVRPETVPPRESVVGTTVTPPAAQNAENPRGDLGA
ncbi:hypothetical protein GCM10011609_39700 [Lentzea pudingi]|uniref:Uncharacterized protein n=1 Tax=Lentzea pudingi TaxID=1789439 RepID=A0ABQ2I4Z5_9PSEU|nr:hypothetical protein [Lentzea pudingi]GGM97837.1 hypothetical protein GCM10011609_39700 [Lentzea pudingi]